MLRDFWSGDEWWSWYIVEYVNSTLMTCVRNQQEQVIILACVGAFCSVENRQSLPYNDLTKYPGVYNEFNYWVAPVHHIGWRVISVQGKIDLHNRGTFAESLPIKSRCCSGWSICLWSDIITFGGNANCTLSPNSSLPAKTQTGNFSVVISPVSFKTNRRKRKNWKRIGKGKKKRSTLFNTQNQNPMNHS